MERIETHLAVRDRAEGKLTAGRFSGRWWKQHIVIIHGSRQVARGDHVDQRLRFTLGLRRLRSEIGDPQCIGSSSENWLQLPAQFLQVLLKHRSEMLLALWRVRTRPRM